MSRYCEETLPAGYVKALVVDANDKKSSGKIRAAALITVVVAINVCFFSYVLPGVHEIMDGFSILKCLSFMLAYILYILLHELTHGIVYKLLTGRKLTFGFKPPAASCGVPDIYLYRKTSLCSLFAPVTVFSILFAVLFFTIGDPFSKALILALFSLHLSGCVGDLYGVGLFLFRFKDPATLRKDTGPVQIYYTKAPEPKE